MSDAIDDLDEFLDNVKETGDHLCKLLFINPRSGKDGKNWVVFKFEVDYPESPFQREEYELWCRDWSHLSLPDYHTLPGKEKTNVRKARNRLKDTLISIGFSEDEATQIRKNPKDELRKEHNGEQFWVAVRVTTNEGREYKNIDKVSPVVDDNGNPMNPPF